MELQHLPKHRAIAAIQKEEYLSEQEKKTFSSTASPSRYEEIWLSDSHPSQGQYPHAS